MNATFRRTSVFVVGLTMVATGCKLDDLTAGDPGPGPEDAIVGTVTVSLTTPHADDGAIRFTVTGPYVTTPRAASAGHLVFTLQRSPQELDVQVLGDLQSEAILILPVRDTRAAPDYQVTITEVATRANAMRTDLSGYGATVVRSTD